MLKQTKTSTAIKDKATPGLAATNMTGMRPILFAIGPANQAPTAHPSKAEETANPWRPALSEN